MPRIFIIVLFGLLMPQLGSSHTHTHIYTLSRSRRLGPSQASTRYLYTATHLRLEEVTAGSVELPRSDAGYLK